MRKALIISGVVLAVFVAILGLALLNLDRWVQGNKAYLLEQAQRALGRRVSAGEIGVTLWGGIGVRLQKITLQDDPAYSQGDFLRADDLQVNVQFLPLLRREVRVTRLIVRKPAITVIRDPRGTFNFASLGGRAEVSRPGKTPQEAGRPPAMPLPFLASLVHIQDGELRYLDQGSGMDFRAKRIDLKLEDVGLDRPISVRLALAAFGSEDQNVKIRGRLGPLGGGGDYSRVPLDAEVELPSLQLAELDRVYPLSAAIPRDLRVEGPIVLSAHVQGTMANLAMNAKGNATESIVRFGQSFIKPKGTTLLLDGEGEMTEQRMRVGRAKVTLHTLELTGTGEVARGKVPSVNLALESNRMPLAGWEKMVPALKASNPSGTMEMRARIQGETGKGKTPKIYGTLTLAGVTATLPSLPKPISDLNAKVSFTGDRADFPETSVRLGNSQLRLAAQVQRFSPLVFTYRLSAPELWVADVRSGGSTGKRPDVLRDVRAEGRAGTGGAGGLSAQARLTSARGTVADVDYTDLQAVANVAGQIITIDSFGVRALDGALQGNGRYEAGGTAPRFTVVTHAKGVDIAQALRLIRPAASEHLRGRADLDLQVAGAGRTWEEIRKVLQGRAQAEVTKGVLANVNIAEGVLAGVTGVPGLSALVPPNVRNKYPEIFATQDTPFLQLKGSATIGEGKVHTQDLLLAAADYSARAKGWVGLDGSLDLSALLTLSQRLSKDIAGEAQGAKYILNDQGRLELPFALAGMYPRVRPKPDAAFLATLVQRGAIRRGTELLEKRLPKGLLGPSDRSPQSDGKSPPPAEPQGKSAPQDAVRKGLDRLFGR